MPRSVVPKMEATPITDKDMKSARREMNERQTAEDGKVRNGRATAAGKGKKGRLTPDGQFVSTHDIVEQVRTLLIRGYTSGEIKRALARKFGGRGRSFEQHIAVARRRNLEVIDKAPCDAKAESMSLWYASLRSAIDFRDRVNAEALKCQQGLENVQKVIDTQPDSATLRRLVEEREEFNERYENTMKRLTYFAGQVSSIQDKIDRMLGTMSPVEIRTEVKIEQDDKPQPLTHEERDEELMSLIKSVQERATAEAKQAAVTPSRN